MSHYCVVSYLNSYKCVNKAKNGFSNIADDVKCRLRRMEHSNNKKELNEAIDELRNWKLYQEKLKTWVEGNQKTIQ